MRLMKSVRTFLVFLAVLSLGSKAGYAQNFSGDARKIALGGVGSSENFATNMVQDRRTYTSIVVPLGLFQVMRTPRIFDPTHPDFDPIRAAENAANPLHYVINRNRSDAGQLLVNDLVNAVVQRDLNAYRGFVPPSEFKAAGLISPSWGKTFNIVGNKDDERFHAFYIGAGPYISVRTDFQVDDDLIDLLASNTNVYRANTQFDIADTTTAQGAAAITLGYRGRLPLLTASPTERDGIYFGANYNYLRGLHYENLGLNLRFDTDQAGLVALQPTTTPVVANRTTSKSGSGLAIDVATLVSVQRWDFGFSARGIGNRITWKNRESERYVLQNLFNGGDFTTIELPSLPGTERVTLPVDYSGTVAYSEDRWSSVAEISRGFQGASFHGGGEYFFRFLEFRGGARYSRNKWHGSTGFGVNVSPAIGIDVAAFETTANVERKRKVGIALSLRLKTKG